MTLPQPAFNPTLRNVELNRIVPLRTILVESDPLRENET